jgi:predicted Ser/Thr protein kinase
MLSSCAVVFCLPLLQVLQHEIRKTHARNQKVEWVDDLVLMETIGKGGFGVVYKGSWKGSLAAIKVRKLRRCPPRSIM